MNLVFVDTQFFIGRINPLDHWYRQTLRAAAATADFKYVTTESVLTELLAYFCGFGPRMRLRVVAMVELILLDAQIEVIPISHEIFLSGLELYKTRPDKEYSLTDCISMNICRERGITEVLSHDHHFEQEGLTVLM